jgi:hypothetical protein
MDCAVIRIRYKDFSAGTHDVAGLQGRTERCARGATLYLLPGLTAGQRRAVIRRLRQEADRGFGPPLPSRQLAVALVLDRVRTAAGIVRAIVRLHPAVTLVPGACVVAMMTLFVVAAGGRPGITPGPRGGFADAATISGGPVSGGTARAVRPGPRHARMTQVTDAGATAAGGTELGSAERVLLKEAPAGRLGKSSPPASAWPGAWYACPPVLAGNSSLPGNSSRARGAQFACRRPGPRAVPRTAHLPGPLDFAW